MKTEIIMHENKKILGQNRFWITSALFYLVSFFIRVQMNACAANVSQNYGLDYGQISFLSAAYYITYALVQIPLGIYFSRSQNCPVNNIQRITIASIFTAVVGTIIVSLSSNFYGILIGRLISGIGCGCAFIMGMESSRIFYKEKDYTIKLAQLNLFCSAGGLLASWPLKKLIGIINFSQVNILVAVFLTILGIYAFQGYENKPRKQEDIQYLSSINKVFKILRKDSILLRSLINCGLICLPGALLIDLYAFSYFCDILKDHSIEEIGYSCLIANFCLGFSGIIMSFVDKIFKNKENYIIQATSLIGIVLSSIIVYSSVNNFTLNVLFIALSLVIGSSILCFKYPVNRLNSDDVPKMSAIFNSSIPMLTTVGQTLSGLILETLGNINSPLTWKITLSIVPISFLLVFILSATGANSVEKLEQSYDKNIA